MKTLTPHWKSTLRSPVTSEVFRRVSRENLTAAVRNVWEMVLEMSTSNLDVRIWQTRDRQGNESWNVYDPKSGTRLQLSSEVEVREWLEARYNA